MLRQRRFSAGRGFRAVSSSPLRRPASLPLSRRGARGFERGHSLPQRRGGRGVRRGSSLPRLRGRERSSGWPVLVSRTVLPAHAGLRGGLDTGTLLRWMEVAACLAAEKHAGMPCRIQSMDEIVFGDTARVGEILSIRARVDIQVEFSMEVGIEVVVEDVLTNAEKIVSVAYATYGTEPLGGAQIELKPIELQSEEDYLEYFLSLDRSIIRTGYFEAFQQVMQESSDEDPSKAEQSISTEHTHVQSTEAVLHSHTGHQGNTCAGQIMDWVQMVASISASRLCRSRPILKEINRFAFWHPSIEYDHLVFKASVNNTFHSSVEVGVRVEAFSCGEWILDCPHPRHVCSAFLIFSALDDKGEPLTFPRVRPTTQDDLRRFYGAIARKRVLFNSKCVLSAKADKPSDAWDSDNQAYLSYKNIAALTYMVDKTRWKIASDKTQDNIKVFTHEDGATLSVKVEMAVKVPFHAAAFLLSDFKLRPRWDKHYSSCEVLEDVNKREKIYHVISGPTAGCQPMDFVILVSQRQPCQPQMPYTVAVRSVAHKAMPPLPEYSRHQVLCSGFQIHSTSSNSCTVYYLLRLPTGTADKAVEDTALACIRFLESEYMERWV
ncbi:acetyl-coenzyme A thioesterase [Zonotrichia leucophrys gambelii]|uniref:acetyl-coenzyme A thioesterase n=1 Tax=Zonotrichia leucophrys gambelii TaxID=257770 RepID=UPI003140BA55